jgi:hypothetical protein
MTVTIPSKKNSTACPPGLVHSCRGLPRSPRGEPKGHDLVGPWIDPPLNIAQQLV